MKRRLVILTEIIAPYRIPVFNALAAREDVEAHVIFLSETDTSLRQWQIYRDEIRFSYQVLKSYRRRVGKFNGLITRGVSAALRTSRPAAILAGGYSYLAMWQARRWARRNNVPFLLWSESTARDARRRFWLVESAKRRFIRSCQRYVVPGSSAAQYLGSFGVSEDVIFVAPNAIDVERFALAAQEARRDPKRRDRFGLPPRYLLYVGRFVRAKGIFDLLHAYAKLPEEVRRDVGLVLAGDGEERSELVRLSRQIDPGRIVLTGFLQRDDLPALYAFAEALVFPTHSDTWGFVVNEAQACGLPVVVTEAAGCAADLVRDGGNGYMVEARNPDALSAAMLKLLNAPDVREQMSQQSRQTSSSWTPQAWAEGVSRSVPFPKGEPHG